MTDTKLPKHWDSMTSYRCYYRKFGPLTLKVNYAASSDRFNASLVVHFDTIIYAMHIGYKLEGETDATMLRCFEEEAKTLIRKWAK